MLTMSRVRKCISNNAQSGITETESRCMHKTITKEKENIVKEFSYK